MSDPLLPLAEAARRATAARALPLLDLTDLADDCKEAAVADLCARAVTPHGPVAAVCLWPRFVRLAKARLAGTPVRVATVVNFPAGGTDTPAVLAETRAAIADGADEIDLVMPYRAFLAGQPEVADAQIRLVREACAAPVRLKVILETGRLAAPDAIRRAADLALAAGADFIKTSTGKVPVNATPEAATLMLEAIRDAGGRAGFKAAGGIRTTADAGHYLGLADRILGAGWATPATFRFGASGLLADLLAHLDGGAPDPSAPRLAY
ncbi:deoxyribose-phosphate aldolase [Prosthecomicrobium sp. N25]|uniref:deoxyribose-phosphate aldolase n=1 Tax=Prosthecomicrobium sp. N25 TaxID=3129254 RepID=UPI003076EFB7